MTIIAIAAIGAYAIRVLPNRSLNTETAEPQPIVHVDPTDPVRGAANAVHTIIEFGDFECPTCGELEPQLKDLLKQSPDLRLVWKDCPSSSHPNAEAAAKAAVCAGSQGKYWEYHDLLIKNQDRLGDDLYPALAASTKLNATAFSSCMTSDAKTAQIQASTVECANAGVTELPTFFVNDKLFSGANANIIHELTVELSKQ